MRSFVTVSDDLEALADVLATHLEGYGYRLKIEEQKLEYPSTPTMVGRRSHTTLIVEVAARIELEKLMAWSAFAKSCPRDTRVALGMPSNPTDAAEHDKLREEGVGLYVVQSGTVTEVLAGRDLAVSIGLPTLADYPTAVRRSLGAAFEQIGRGNWREGFEDACVALESEARRYLKRHMATGRIVIVNAKGIRLTGTSVDRMTIGKLAATFLRIPTMNVSDSKIAGTLKQINDDRIRVAHKKGTGRAEAALRRNVGRMVWTITANMEEVFK
jgi:hypothetical protein